MFSIFLLRNYFYEIQDFYFSLAFVGCFRLRSNKGRRSVKITGQTNDRRASTYDPAALDKLLTADYIEISPVGEFDPHEKVLGFYKPELKPPAEKMTAMIEATDFSIRSYGKFAIVITRLNYTIMSEGKPLPPRSISATFVCRMEKSVWKIASAQYTGIRMPQPAK